MTSSWNYASARRLGGGEDCGRERFAGVGGEPRGVEQDPARRVGRGHGEHQGRAADRDAVDGRAREGDAPGEALARAEAVERAVVDEAFVRFGRRHPARRTARRRRRGDLDRDERPRERRQPHDCRGARGGRGAAAQRQATLAGPRVAVETQRRRPRAAPNGEAERRAALDERRDGRPADGRLGRADDAPTQARALPDLEGRDAARRAHELDQDRPGALAGAQPVRSPPPPPPPPARSVPRPA